MMVFTVRLVVKELADTEGFSPSVFSFIFLFMKGEFIVDKNGREIKRGDTVLITGGFFKADNGLHRVERAPGDPGWLGNDWSLRRLNKNGTISTGKYTVSFWPLTVTVSSRDKRIEAKRHNKEHATIEVVSQ